MNVSVMSFHVLHTSIPVLENLTFTDEEVIDFGHYLKNRTGISEVVTLPTCNRTEIYFAWQGNQDVCQNAIRALADYKGVNEHSLIKAAKILNNDEVVDHLFNTIAGLKSLAIGESEIQGQIKNAYHLARENHLAQYQLCVLFEAAIHAGKRVRSETDLGKQKISLSTLTLDILAEKIDLKPHIHFTILGTGKMAKSAADYLLKKGLSNLRLVSKHPRERIQSPALRNLQICSFAVLPSLLERSDVIFAAYGTEEIFITKEFLADIFKKRKKPLYIIDIALPRDVDPGVKALPGVYLIDFSAFESPKVQTRLESNHTILQARQIIREELTKYLADHKQRELGQAILRLRQHFEAISQAELQKTLRGLSHLPEKDQEKIKKLSYSIVHKFLHKPTVLLRSKAVEGNAESYMEILEDLFEIKFRNGFFHREKLN